MARLSDSGSGAAASSSSTPSSSSQSDKQKAKLGGQRKRKRDEKDKESGEAKGGTGPGDSDKKTKKTPSFLTQTASGRMPKMADRFEASSSSGNNSNSNNIKQEPTEELSEEDKKRKLASTSLLSGAPDFEKSVRALERDLRMLPATAAGTMHPMLKKVKKECVAEEAKGEEAPKAEAEPHDDDDDAEDEEEEEEEEDSYELTEWFPPPDSWSCLQKVVVTDVTVDDITVTMRECGTPEGFFAQTPAAPV